MHPEHPKDAGAEHTLANEQNFDSLHQEGIISDKDPLLDQNFQGPPDSSAFTEDHHDKHNLKGSSTVMRDEGKAAAMQFLSNTSTALSGPRRSRRNAGQGRADPAMNPPVPEKWRGVKDRCRPPTSPADDKALEPSVDQPSLTTFLRAVVGKWRVVNAVKDKGVNLQGAQIEVLSSGKLEIRNSTGLVYQGAIQASDCMLTFDSWTAMAKDFKADAHSPCGTHSTSSGGMASVTGKLTWRDGKRTATWARASYGCADSQTLSFSIQSTMQRGTKQMRTPSSRGPAKHQKIKPVQETNALDALIKKTVAEALAGQTSPIAESTAPSPVSAAQASLASSASAAAATESAPLVEQINRAEDIGSGTSALEQPAVAVQSRDESSNYARLISAIAGVASSTVCVHGHRWIEQTEGRWKCGCGRHNLGIFDSI
eukprot:gnl/MRDRNA2_/MRDRNA2_127790_c0_seq1.p1 gnl/MRDRNA2_/MRDRNA2_127790_c0~~gnl/MRDRNA2_/MRDRNA2_127790_c0_seq1.p1  ORF type:complete len:427 (-),score=83.47 gnl/MRDRNA2_/MRDRNA2_127790_c0_seq1:516-1796(-)